MSFVSTSFVNFCLFIILKFSFHTHRKRKCNTLEFWFFFFVSSDTIFFCFLFSCHMMKHGKNGVASMFCGYFLFNRGDWFTIDAIVRRSQRSKHVTTFLDLSFAFIHSVAGFVLPFCFAFARLITIFTVLLVSVDFKTFARHGRFPSP